MATWKLVLMRVLTLSMDNKRHKMSVRTQRFNDQLLTIIPLLPVGWFLVELERIKCGENVNFSAIFRLAKPALPFEVQWSWFCMLRIEIVKREFLPGKHYPKAQRNTRTSQQSPDPKRTAHAQEQQETTVDLLQGELPWYPRLCLLSQHTDKRLFQELLDHLSKNLPRRNLC